jgi:sec-independent protein translocase protein TatA
MEIFGLGAPELLLILFVLLLFFGKDKLPDLARSIGASFKELKNGFSDGAAATKEDEKKGAAATKEDEKKGAAAKKS